MKLLVRLLFVAILFNACQDEYKDKYITFKNVECVNNSESMVNLSELITDSVRIIPLETKEESIVGKINKIKKSNDRYYILSNDKWLFQFDKNGKHISTMIKQGGGSEEYTNINDFDINIENYENPEIWIADNNKIKIYDAINLKFKNDIKFPFIISKFKIINSNEIIVMTCQKENSLFVTNKYGEIQSDFLAKETPFLLFRAIQFKQHTQSSIIFQLGISNDYVSYNPISKKFSDYSFFTDKESLLSQDKLIDLYDQQGQGFVMLFNKYKHIKAFSMLSENSWFIINNKENRYFSKITSKTTTAQILPTCNIYNDIFSVDDFTFLNTLGFGESANSLLFYLDSENINKIILYNSNDTLSVNGDNPIIIEFY